MRWNQFGAVFGIGLCTASIALAGVNDPTFTRNVAPILYENCVTCHRPGEIAPMSLLTYEETRPWAKSIRKAVANREMPPWDAAAGHLPLANDISLSQDDIDTIVAWVDAGVPRGSVEMLPSIPEFSNDWKLGKPDYVIDIGSFDIPGESDDIFITKAFRLDLPEPAWIRAVEVRPGDRRVLHHLVGFKGFFEMDGGGENMTQDLVISDQDRRNARPFNIWAAGTPPTVFPDGMGYRVSSDQLLSFNIHYHPYGESTTDRSQIGLYFGEGDIKKEIATGVTLNTGIQIPPGSTDTVYRASHVFGRDSKIISFFPHLHERGKSMTYRLTTPDGHTQTLLEVPGYDFNWQWSYYLEEPVSAPKGSRIETVAGWDNSAENPNNPDPTLFVEFGDGTNDEMFIGFFEYIPTEGVSSKRYRTQDVIDEVLAVHPPEETYRLEVDAGMVKLAWGLHLPKEGSGTFYLLEAPHILTITTHEIRWLNDSEAVIKARVFRDAGSTIPVGIHFRKGESGAVTGGFFFGRDVPDPPDSQEPHLSFTGRRMDQPAPPA